MSDRPMRYGGPPRGSGCPRCGGLVEESPGLPQPVEDAADGTLWVRYVGQCRSCRASLVRSTRVRPVRTPWQFAPQQRAG